MTDGITTARHQLDTLMDCHRTCNHNHQTLCNELDEFLQKMEILPSTKAVKGLAKSPSAGHANTKVKIKK
jgi:hypothetical protein